MSAIASAATATAAAPRPAVPRARVRGRDVHRSLRAAHLGACSRRALLARAGARSRPRSLTCRAASGDDFGPMERARGGDFAGAATCFVDAFFLRKGNARDVVTASELAYLNGAQKKDLLRRYNQRGLGTMFVIKNAGGKVVACVGAEVQTFVGAVPQRRAKEGASAEPKDRAVVANLAVAEEARRRGLAKALMAAIEEEIQEWGFDEAVLVVEKSNRGAMSLYKKLGYRGIGGEKDTPNLVIDENGKVREADVATTTMRKSLKGGLEGAIENVDPVAVIGIGAGVSIAAKVVADGGVGGFTL